jgi:predicted nucleic acid-binding protein
MEMILDTNALSALADGDEALDARLADTPVLSVPVIALGEYRYGIQASRHRSAYEGWLEENLPHFELLPVTEMTARVYARLRQELKTLGRPIPENDLWIAALAREHRRPLLSRDRHFSGVPHLEVRSW